MDVREAKENCIFCKIIEGEAPVSTVYEDDLVLGLMTIGPVTPGHAMVIPKQHVPYFSDLSPDLGAHIFKVTQRVAAAIRESGLRCEGVNLFLADGEAAFQDIFHFHLHVFPRFGGDPFRLVADWDVHPPRKELDQNASMIREAYRRLFGEGE
jgi:histidine triad (HIT) family protein